MEDGYLHIHIKTQSSHFEKHMHCSVVLKEAFEKSVDLVDYF